MGTKKPRPGRTGRGLGGGVGSVPPAGGETGQGAWDAGRDWGRSGGADLVWVECEERSVVAIGEPISGPVVVAA